jgi:hypothetical protein
MASTFCSMAAGYGLGTYRFMCVRANSKTRGARVAEPGAAERKSSAAVCSHGSTEKK